jgi:hypothetical protein
LKVVHKTGNKEIHKTDVFPSKQTTLVDILARAVEIAK